MANIGYARCSTLAQDLTAQRQALAALGVPADRVYRQATTSTDTKITPSRHKVTSRSAGRTKDPG